LIQYARYLSGSLVPSARVTVINPYVNPWVPSAEMPPRTGDQMAREVRLSVSTPSASTAAAFPSRKPRGPAGRMMSSANIALMPVMRSRAALAAEKDTSVVSSSSSAAWGVAGCAGASGAPPGVAAMLLRNEPPATPATTRETTMIERLKRMLGILCTTFS
jgi:hypothetical protein